MNEIICRRNVTVFRNQEILFKQFSATPGPKIKKHKKSKSIDYNSSKKNNLGKYKFPPIKPISSVQFKDMISKQRSQLKQ